MNPDFIPYRLAGTYLRKVLQDNDMPFPTVGVICGSGLSGLSRTLQGNTLTVKYSDIPGFPTTSVAGHKGEVVFGMLSGVPAICFRGRFHVYEGNSPKTTVLPVYVMRALNVKVVMITNAAGGLNPNYNVGDIVAISDHLAIPQLAGVHPLAGPNDEMLGPRFTPVSNAYPKTLRDVANKAAGELGIDFFRQDGTYCFVIGPTYESKAECKFLQLLGGDAVGMSTIPEVTAAHHCGMQVLCTSLITNKVVMVGEDDKAAANHEEVLAVVNQRSKEMESFVSKIVELLARDVLNTLPELETLSLEVPPQTVVPEWVPKAAMGAALVAVGMAIGTRLKTNN